MWPDRVSNPGPLTYESGALPTAQRGPANQQKTATVYICMHNTTHTMVTVLVVFSYPATVALLNKQLVNTNKQKTFD